MMDLKIREFENAILGFCSKTDLPVEVKRLVINDIARQIGEKADLAVLEENEKRNKKEAARKGKA